MKVITEIIYQQGQSLLEAIIAMAVFVLVVVSIATLVLGSFAALRGGGEQTEAVALAQEGIEAVRSIKDGAWNELKYSQSKVNISGSQWVLSGEGTTEQIGKYTRAISFSDVCRDLNNDIVNCPGVYKDVHSRKVSVSVSWQVRDGVENSVQQIAYLTNWQSVDWKEDLLNEFNDGILQNTATSTALGEGDGAVILLRQ